MRGEQIKPRTGQSLGELESPYLSGRCEQPLPAAGPWWAGDVYPWAPQAPQPTESVDRVGGGLGPPVLAAGDALGVVSEGALRFLEQPTQGTATAAVPRAAGPGGVAAPGGTGRRRRVGRGAPGARCLRGAPARSPMGVGGYSHRPRCLPPPTASAERTRCIASFPDSPN